MREINVLLIAISTLLLSHFSVLEAKEVNVATYFQSGMVIQQNKPFIVWGTADVGTAIMALLGDETKETETNEQGNWAVTFSSRKASFDALSLNVNNKIYTDILVGEVWLCSGQSNMAMKLNASRPKAEDLEHKDFDNIRFFNHSSLRTVAKGGYNKEELERCNTQDLFTTNWSRVDLSLVKKQSAVAWYFAINLYEELHVPIGIVVSAVGGSAINNWIPADVAKKNPLTSDLYTTDWLTNEDVYVNHRTRGKDAFKTVLPDNGEYIIEDMAFRYLCEPDMLFESSLAKLSKVKFKGVVWYQGESDAVSMNAVKRYESLLPLMIQSWRTHFDHKDLPFIIIQLPRYKKDTWPAMRIVQNNIVEMMPNTSLVTTIDLGDEANIHPKDKKPVGERVCNMALNNVYNLESPQSPIIKSHRLKKNKIILHLDNVGEKLRVENSDVSGFEIKGEDGKYHAVNVHVIDEELIEIVTNMHKPKSIRYLWAPFPNPTIFNSYDLPLGPFEIIL